MADTAGARVALATCAQVPNLDDETRSLIAPLARLGVRAEARVWDDPAVDWEEFDLTVVRCCWDYHQKHAQFLSWADALAQVANPSEVLAWNTDKTYLQQLETAGVPTVPTTWLGSDQELPCLAPGAWVVKPTVSLAGMDTGLYRTDVPDEAAQMRQHVDRLRALDRGVMVQPFQSSVAATGETSLVFFDEEFSHAVVRSAAVHGPADGADHRFEAPPGHRVEPVTPAPAEMELAEAVLDLVPAPRPLLYARVDMVAGRAGEPVLMEIELTEPQLFLRHCDGAPSRLARAIATRAQ